MSSILAPPPPPPTDSPIRPTSDRWAARLTAFMVGSVVLILLALLLWGVGRRAAGTVGEAPVQTRPAPPFSLQLFDGRSFNLEAAAGKPLVLNFWASWCVPCEQEAAVLERAYRTYGDTVTFLGIDVQDTEANALGFLRKFGVTYPNGRDASGEIAIEYGMSGVPETYFIGRDGRLARKWQGPLDDARLGAFLAELLQ